jgi:hypothetical protein
MGMDSKAWSRKNDGVLECVRQSGAPPPLCRYPTKSNTHSPRYLPRPLKRIELPEDRFVLTLPGPGDDLGCIKAPASAAESLPMKTVSSWF